MSANGVISGKPTSATSTINVLPLADGWAAPVQMSNWSRSGVAVKVNVLPTVVVEEIDGTYKVSANEKIVIEEAPTVNDELGTSAITAKTISSVENLPAGLSYDAETGVISGTPEVAGLYEVKITARITKVTVTSSWFGNSLKTSNENVTKILTIGEAVEPDWTENVPYIGENGNWWVNGVDLGVAAQGPAGEKGETGETGAQGPQGEKGADAAGGCGSTVATGIASIALLGAAFIALRKREN